MLTTFCFCPAFLRTFAHRALWAAPILALAAADKRLRVPALFPYEPPLSAASAAVESFESSRSLIPLFPQLLDNASQVSHEFPLAGELYQDAIRKPILPHSAARSGWGRLGVSQVKNSLCDHRSDGIREPMPSAFRLKEW
jgi:hypothetical protein